MKNVILTLLLAVLGTGFSLANTQASEVEKELVKSEILNNNIGPGEHTCHVEDGLNEGTGTGRTARQACRRARRELRRNSR